MSKKLKVLDLFSGVGGFSYGFIQSKFEVVAAVEYDKSIAESYQRNHKNSYVFVGDIKNINPEDVKTKVGEIDVIVGGPPCQGFSLKGKRLGLEDDRNFLFRKFIDYVKFFSPSYFVIENVTGILSSNNGYFVNEILSQFGMLNYKVEFGVLNASNFGVPQNRKRAFFIGTKYQDEVNLPKQKREIKDKVTVWDAISDLAYLDSGEGTFESNYTLKAQTPYQNLMRFESTKLYNHIATNHSEIALDRLRRIPPEKGKEYLTEKISSTFGQTWGRLEKNKQSPTIITRFDTPSNGKNSHPYLHRAITPREAARLQSFPDTFIFYGNKSSIIKQIGNAVPPLLGSAIAKAIYNHYETQ